MADQVQNHSLVKKRCVAADSSSLILLQKVGLLELLARVYRLVVADSVLKELVDTKKKGANELHRLLGDKVVSPEDKVEKKALGAGESDILQLYREGVGDFVLLDDKKAALTCKNEGIPFINSLLLARILFCTGYISIEECARSKELLQQYGYYSEKIVRRSETIEEEDLARFFPF